MKHPERILLWVRARNAREQGQWDIAAELDRQLQAEKLGAARPTLDALEARLERLDARRKESPGQLGLDLGGGQPCGQSHIAPNLTCHKGAGGAAAPPAPPGPLDPRTRFSPEVMGRLKAGIEQRTFTSNTWGRQGAGSELSAALEKLATAPGPMGERVREAMAFMDENRSIVVVGPVREALPKLKMNVQPPPTLDLDQPLQPQIDKLESYLQDGRDLASRGRRFGERMGMLSPELLAAYEADKSPEGDSRARSLRKALHPDSAETTPYSFAGLSKAFDEAVAAHQANPGDNNAQLELRLAYERVKSHSWGTGPHADYMAVEDALRQASGYEGTGGHYTPGGNSYTVVGQKASGVMRELKAAEVDPGRVAEAIGVQVMLRDISPAPVLSAHPDLTLSEKILVTHLHELGHLIHDTSQRQIERDETGTTIGFDLQGTTRIPTAAKRVLLESGGVTAYANTNEAELFAESFAAYTLAPVQFAESSPVLADWVRQNISKARSVARASQEASQWFPV